MAVTKPSAVLFLSWVEKKSNGIFFYFGRVYLSAWVRFPYWMLFPWCSFYRMFIFWCWRLAGPACRLAMKHNLFRKSTHPIAFICGSFPRRTGEFESWAQRAAPLQTFPSAALACFAFATIASMFSPNSCATLLPLRFLRTAPVVLLWQVDITRLSTALTSI